MRLSLPSKDAVRTDATFTLNTASTAARISTLLASGRTLNATVFNSSFCRMLFSVMSGRIRMSRGARFTAPAPPRAPRGRRARTPRDGRRAPGRPTPGSASRRRATARCARPARAPPRPPRPPATPPPRRGPGRRGGEPRHVARGPRERRAALADHEQRPLPRETERCEILDQRLRPGSLGRAERLDDRELPARELGRHGGAQRLAAHGARHLLPVAPRRRAEGLTAALPLRGADRALPGPAGALLPPRLPAAARHLAPPLRVVRARAPVGELSHDRLVEQRPADLDSEDVGLELQRPGLLALGVQHLYGRHRLFLFRSLLLLRLGQLHALADHHERPAGARHRTAHQHEILLRQHADDGEVQHGPPVAAHAAGELVPGPDARRVRGRADRAGRAVEHRAVRRVTAGP